MASVYQPELRSANHVALQRMEAVSSFTSAHVVFFDLHSSDLTGREQENASTGRSCVIQFQEEEGGSPAQILVRGVVSETMME